MELDDLKKTWNVLDKQLQTKEIVTDEELLQVTKQKKDITKGTLNALIKNSRNILLTTIFLMLFIVFVKMYDGIFLSEPYFWTLVALLPPALAWSIYTLRYLAKTRIDEMPLATVIERVNKYNYWMSMERILGAIILFAFALIFIISTNLLKDNLTDQIIIFSIWILGFVFYFWFINKYTFKRLKEIRKNLNELKELNR